MPDRGRVEEAIRPSLPTILALFAAVCAYKGKFKTSVILLEHATGMGSPGGRDDPFDKAYLWNRIGVYYLNDIKDNIKAKDYFSKGEWILRPYENQGYVFGRVKANLGLCYHLLNDVQKALGLYEEAITCFGQHPLAVMPLSNWIHIQKELLEPSRNNYQAVLDRYKQLCSCLKRVAVDEERDCNIYDDYVQTYFRLAEYIVFDEEKDGAEFLERARSVLKEAKERLNGETSQVRLLALEGFLELQEEDFATAQQKFAEAIQRAEKESTLNRWIKDWEIKLAIAKEKGAKK